MIRPSTKTVNAVLGAVTVIGTIVFVTITTVDDLPTWERASAWRWFFVGWAGGVIAVWLYLLPYWIRGTIAKPIPGREDEMRYYLRIMPWAAGLFGSLTLALGIATTSVIIGSMSLTSGGITGLLILFIVLRTTKKGRAMLAERGA